ncbi:MAG: hypothetical protein KJ749_08370, partial [Planctomycetes bacterium]|nr:hypothetical protein [Planctomycetota bacterium]
MQTIKTILLAILILPALGTWGAGTLRAEETIKGEQLDPSSYGPSFIESMEDAVARGRLAPLPVDDKDPAERRGAWAVPTRGASGLARSGKHYVTNKWGDPRMGIGFPDVVDVHGAYFSGQATTEVWARGIRVLGYHDGQPVGQTDWFVELSTKPTWFAMNLNGVDRIEIVAIPAPDGAGWYAMDDLTYSAAVVDGQKESGAPKIVVDFDGLSYRQVLTDSGYAGLTWETGAGSFDEGVHGPMAPREFPQSGALRGESPAAPSRDGGTPPTLLTSYQGVIRGDAGSMSYPPDTDGAVGPNHYVETVNRNFAVYNKATGTELSNILLGTFLPGSNGDPRVLYDQHSGRWIVIVSDFSSSIYLAVSLTSNPTGGWFKTSFVASQGSDSGCGPDYPTLGVDANGIYTASYMMGCGGMSVFAIDKAPLVAPSPSLGTVTAFRGLPFESAIQPVHAYGTPPGEYLVSISSSSQLRLRRIDPPMVSPTLVDLGTIGVASFSSPPNAPALGSTTALNTVDWRLMMSVYRDGSVWTAHTISVSGRAACRWYELDVATMAAVQSGTLADSTLNYFFPSIMVNQAGGVAMGFTGSNASQYAGCYFTGRVANDPAGEM